MELTGKALDILEAARTLFSKNGFSAVTTREIARQAKVNEVTIFRQFESKEKLFEQVLKNLVFKPSMDEYIHDDEKELKVYLQGIADVIHSVFTQNIELFQIELMERKKLEGRMHISKFPNEIKNRLITIFMNSLKVSHEDAEIRAIAFMSSIHGLCINIYFLNTFDPKPDFKKCAAFLIEQYE